MPINQQWKKDIGSLVLGNVPEIIFGDLGHRNMSFFK